MSTATPNLDHAAAADRQEIGRGVWRERRVLHFDHWPRPDELFRRGGHPGVNYVVVLANNVARAQSMGYDHIEGSEPLMLVGPKSTAPAVVLGYGRPIPGGRPEQSVRVMRVDRELVEATGLPHPTTGDEHVLLEQTEEAQVQALPTQTPTQTQTTEGQEVTTNG